jgi:hypothetical protein
MVDEDKYFKRFKLDEDESVLIKKYSCFYLGGKIPVLGSLFIFNNYVCYSSKYNINSLFISNIKIKIAIKDVIIVESDEGTLGRYL